MTDKLPDVWTTRDFPVLREATKLIDQRQSASLTALQAGTGLDLAEVVDAIHALKRRGFITPDQRSAGPMGIKSISGEAYELTGLHPDPSDPVERLVAALLQAAEDASDEQDKSRLRRAAEAVGGVSKSVASGVITGLITGGLGL